MYPGTRYILRISPGGNRRRNIKGFRGSFFILVIGRLISRSSWHCTSWQWRIDSCRVNPWDTGRETRFMTNENVAFFRPDSFILGIVETCNFILFNSVERLREWQIMVILSFRVIVYKIGIVDKNTGSLKHNFSSFWILPCCWWIKAFYVFFSRVYKYDNLYYTRLKNEKINSQRFSLDDPTKRI